MRPRAFTPVRCSCTGHFLPGITHPEPCCDEPHCDELPDTWEHQDAQVVVFPQDDP